MSWKNCREANPGNSPRSLRRLSRYSRGAFRIGLPRAGGNWLSTRLTMAAGIASAGPYGAGTMPSRADTLTGSRPPCRDLPPIPERPRESTSRYRPGSGPSKNPLNVDDCCSTASSWDEVKPSPSSSAVIAPADEPLIPMMRFLPGWLISIGRIFIVSSARMAPRYATPFPPPPSNARYATFSRLTRMRPQAPSRPLPHDLLRRTGVDDGLVLIRLGPDLRLGIFDPRRQLVVLAQ